MPLHEIGVERARARFKPGQPILESASRRHGIEDAHVVHNSLEEHGSADKAGKRRFISDDAFRTFVAVLETVGGLALLAKVFVPPALGLALLALMYYFSPGMAVVLGVVSVASGWVMWWAVSRAKELDGEGDSNE